ncbi:unnamed protein product [Onchocerca ochengi]|uniref:Clathrin_bdg domain-containing protein n=1 Tax=Onchocerca ochengi TaxID=42157 RepID=A0A182EHB7_ONCOC|nr:unnamed protein product [Onchocerca ochengi]
MDSESAIECTNNLDKYSNQRSSDELSSNDGSSGCDSDADISWSSEAEMNFQQNNYTSRSDKNDKLPIGDIENGDSEIVSSLYNSDTTKDDDSNSDSDEEFAVHACLRGLIKSKSISSIQKNDYAIPLSYTDEELLDSNTFIKTSNGKYLDDRYRFINTQSISDEETSASSAPYFSRNQAFHNYRTPIFETISNTEISDNWSTQANNFKYGTNFESDDDLDQARSSPFTCCWSAPEFIADNEQTSEELSSSEDACFAERNEKTERPSLPCADLSEYDESMGTSILDFSGPESVQITNLTHLNLSRNTCPRVISENDSLCIYDASPSPHQEEEEINFADELPEIEETIINKWTPEAIINFAKKSLRENSEIPQHLRENHDAASTIVNISKSLGSLDLWETELGWITRVPSPMDHSGITMRQSVSCHDHMITSYVDCVIQNHYNRCSSPDCRKYASKPEIMKQSMNSVSDTSDDEWIRCADDAALDESFVSDRIENDICSHITVPIFSTPNVDNHSSINIDQHFNDFQCMDATEQIDNDNKNEGKMKKCERPTTFLTTLKKIVDKEDLVKITTNAKDNQKNDQFLSYQEKKQNANLIDSISSAPPPRRSYSLNILDQIPVKLINFEKESNFFKTKVFANNIDEKQYCDEIRNLSNFHKHTTYYPNMYHKNDIEYGSDESDENDNDDNDDDNDNDNNDNDHNDMFVDQTFPANRNKLPNFYEFTFDVKKSIRNDTTKLSTNIDSDTALYPFLEKFKSDTDNQVMAESQPTVTLWDNSCEYAQQINEIARVWLQKSSDPSNVDQIITDQTAVTVYPKS